MIPVGKAIVCLIWLFWIMVIDNTAIGQDNRSVKELQALMRHPMMDHSSMTLDEIEKVRQLVIDKRITYMEKDLSAVLVQSERFKKSTRVFAKDNVCASCHLEPDHLLHNLQSKFPSFSDIKGFMRVGHMRYYTATTPVTDEELMAVYRTLK